MESSDSVSSVIMYEDESVDIRYGNGAQLQLSPCGCEFLLIKHADPSGHPLQPTERVRQRTRFTISAYKGFLLAALAFRNKYASRPYLPEEVIPAEHRKPFFSINSAVLWPEVSSCEAELGPAGETIVRSEDGQALLKLAPSGEEFFVEFTCSLSQTQNQHTQGFIKDSVTSLGRQHPEEIYQSTTVVQHYSCSAFDPIWRYPLSLAHHFMSTRLSKPEDVGAEGASHTPDVFTMERGECLLPRALPLTCPSLHWHRWRIKDPLAKKNLDQDLSTELVKVMWCQGVTYRILSGAVSVIEVSPGDGSVIRSHGVLNTYFTHHKTELSSGKVKELTYHLNNLPPDVPGQLYSIRSVVSRASRILTCYKEAKESVKLPAMPSCLQDVKKGRSFTNPESAEENLSNSVAFQQLENVAETMESRSDLVCAELEKIKRFNFLLENSHLLKSNIKCKEEEGSSTEEFTQESLSEDCIAEALQKTSKAIQEIDALISAVTLT